jgi:phage tail-like protein
MVGERKDPYRNFKFLLEIDGLEQACFSEVTIPDTTSDVVEYRDGCEPTTVRKLPGLTKYGNVTLKWGITDSMDLYDARKNVAIILMDEEGNPAARWEFVEAWPSKYDAPDLNAKGTDVAIENLEIVHEGMKRVKP